MFSIALASNLVTALGLGYEFTHQKKQVGRSFGSIWGMVIDLPVPATTNSHTEKTGRCRFYNLLCVTELTQIPT